MRSSILFKILFNLVLEVQNAIYFWSKMRSWFSSILRSICWAPRKWLWFASIYSALWSRIFASIMLLPEQMNLLLVLTPLTVLLPPFECCRFPSNICTICPSRLGQPAHIFNSNRHPSHGVSRLARWVGPLGASPSATNDRGGRSLPLGGGVSSEGVSSRGASPEGAHPSPVNSC